MNDQFALPAFPMPPSVNQAYNTQIMFRSGVPHSCNGFRELQTRAFPNRVLSKEATEYKRIVSKMMNESGITTQLRDFVQFHVTVDVHIYAYAPNWFTKLENKPNKNAGDADGRVKLLQDVIFKAIGVDDSSAFYTGIRKLHGEEKKVIVIFRKTPDEVDEFG